MNFKKIEKKWQKKWACKKIFESDIEKRKKFFITVPYPYVNGAPHIGHSYTYFRTDAYARFKRMQGFNVLYPQGFHATGEPIFGVIERLKKKDRVQIETLKRFGARDSDIKKFIKSPKFLINFWMKRWIQNLNENGFSIDWRRTFVTTSLTPTYSRFIEWQYNTLRKKGYVIQGTHPVIWCSKCQSPTGDHDRLKGEGESPIEYVLLKFKIDDFILPAATLRPETIYGVTNIWLKPNVNYAKISVENEKWLVSEECVPKLRDQMKNVEFIGRINSSELFGKMAENPITGNKIPILPSEFVNLENATGVVMSVPSHAPYDWIALREMIDSDALSKLGFSKNDVEPVSVVKSPEFGEQPAMEICKKLEITSLKQQKELDEATNTLYKKEFHTGLLNDNCAEYAGLKVNESKEKLVVDFIEKGVADAFWDCIDVVCRCTTRCHVKILENQWFLKFSDEEWKNLVRKCLGRMNIYPEEARNNFSNTIDWLMDKACTRKSGFGTLLPWDKEWIIETLSDSTIYMAYYTISGIISKNKITAKKLTDSVFDFIFSGKGDLNKIAKESGLSKKLIKDMKNEFEYFYPLDMRVSAKDLIQNHLTFFLFHHTAMFQEKYWPRGISVNGYVNIEGEKMSKSVGNIIPLADVSKLYGSDFTRINIVGSGEDLTDADWRVENLKGFRARYELLFDIIKNLKKSKRREMNNIDLYLQSKLQKNINIATESFESMKFRTCLNYALFDLTNDIKWYLKRVGGMGGANKKVIQEYAMNIVRILAPLTPHLCEEMWQMLGNKKFVSIEEFPKYNVNQLNEEAELSESMIKQTINDIEEIKQMTKINPKKITLFIAEIWKFRVYQTVLRNKDKGINEITKEIMAGDARVYGNATVLFIQTLYKKLNELKPVASRIRQMQILNESKHFLENELKCRVDIIDAEKTENQKAKSATPQKFGIYLE